ncbi:acyl-CoA dehydrogenase family protein [Novosphingobium sp.]|uniref:acyl-CoA dehydrogenase family protein n=1 Tax=Novosphingobium sp. TaxID=1874826 RepID=UPI00286E8B04|nr:acyl-CoA dehydrogenase family protein [Novosphingobium sp.]
MEASAIDDGILASFADTVQRFADERLTLDRWRELSASAVGFSRDDWHEMALLGWHALPLDPEHSGFGGGAIGVAIIMEAAGRGLMLEPYLASVILSGSLLGQCADPAAKSDMLPRIASGETVFALAHLDGSSVVMAKLDGADWRLSGEKLFVLGGDVAQRLLVTAATPDGLALFLVEANAQGFSRTPFALLDGRRAADLQLDGVTAKRLQMADVAASLSRIVCLGTIAICCEALGVMTALNQTTLEYVKTRKQFGMPIGKFQALQHRLVDMHVIEQEARAIVRAAISAYDGNHSGTELLTSAAKLRVNAAAQLVSEGAVQLHGGIGVTDELIVGHYFKRLATIRSMFGDSYHHAERLSILAAL